MSSANTMLSHYTNDHFLPGIGLAATSGFQQYLLIQPNCSFENTFGFKVCNTTINSNKIRH